MKKITEKEWQTILLQNPTNDDLKYLIAYTEYKSQAGELLSKNEKMIDIIRKRN